ncbi:MAG: DNA sulfur modification protein DndE [Crocosphaera sp.]|nr:DNA sulfur modification protein DndE [Crocosphaera sp.]
MESPIKQIRLSQEKKDQLITIKRYTKIEQWNILCRWGFCRSLAEPSIPSPVPIILDSNLEMTWRVFGGEMADLLLIALKQRCYKDNLGTEKETLVTQFKLHLHRGIGYLAGDISSKKIQKIENLIELATNKQ